MPSRHFPSGYQSVHSCMVPLVEQISQIHTLNIVHHRKLSHTHVPQPIGQRFLLSESHYLESQHSLESLQTQKQQAGRPVRPTAFGGVSSPPPESYHRDITTNSLKTFRPVQHNIQITKRNKNQFRVLRSISNCTENTSTMERI